MHGAAETPVALVTGSGRRRVGHVVARALGQRGYRLVIHYHRSGDEAFRARDDFQQAGVECIALQADVSREEEVDRLFDQLLAHYGRLDVAVTTSSTWDSQTLEELTAEDVRRSFEVNTLGTLLCCRRAGLVMAGQPQGGAIITLGDWAIKRPYRNYLAYFTAKGALPTLTRALAVELAARNPRVRVNCIHPGPVMFPAEMSAAERQETIAATLVQQADCPESVARAVEFFIDSQFVTGVCLPVDGGRTIFAPG